MNWRSIVLAAAIAAFYLPGFRDVPDAFATSARWLLLGVLVVVNLPVSVRGLNLLPGSVVAFVTMYLWYAFLSVSWSEVPKLSFYKAIANAAVCLGFLIAGATVRAASAGDRYLPLMLIHGVFVFTSLIAIAIDPSSLADRFQGLTFNPNMLGSGLAFTAAAYMIPFVAGSQRNRMGIGWVGALVLIDASLIFLTGSRTSMGFFCLEVSGILLTLTRGKRGLILASAPLCVVLVLSLAGYTQSLGGRAWDFVFRGRGGDILESRRDIWEESREKALEGGTFGLGFGISSGVSRDWNGQLTNIGSFREKGSSQYAVMEELGIVGLVIYAGLMISLVTSALATPASWHSRNILLAFIVGSMAFSVFEAFFTAPGSPESATLWLMLGLAFGSRPNRPNVGYLPRVTGTGRRALVHG